MFFREPPRRTKAVNPFDDDSRFTTPSRNLKPLTVVSEEESDLAARALMRKVYDEALAEGTITPIADDLTGWRIGDIVVEKRTASGDWILNNPRVTPSRYSVRVEALMSFYATGDLNAPL